MTVYIVLIGTGYGDNVEGVFDSNEKAVNFSNQLKAEGYGEVTILRKKVQ